MANHTALLPVGELLPCPFCQAPAELFNALRDGPYHLQIAHHAGCPLGNWKGTYWATKAEARAAWNARAAHRLQAPAEAGEEVERVAKVYKLKVKHREDYGGEHREWEVEYILPEWLVEQIQGDVITALRANAGEGEGGVLPQWRCVNCKAVVSSSGEPDRCLTCEWCTEFATVAQDGDVGS